MNKGFAIAVCCAVMAMMTSAALADGRPSDSKLRQMGLYGAPVVSDDAAMEVRGMGWSSARAWGFSLAGNAGEGGIAGTVNGYRSHGKHLAGGSNLSYAGELEVESVYIGHFGITTIDLDVVFAGGSSRAYAH